MSAPAAKTRSPPYTTTALTSSRAVASVAAARISSCTWTFSAFILGRSSRIVPTPSATSSRTNSPVPAFSAPVMSCSASPRPGSGRIRSAPASTFGPRHCAVSATMVRVTPGLWRNRGERAPVWPGRHFPLGSTWEAEATNFAVHAPEATSAWVCLFDEDGGETRHRLTERTLGIWHGEIPGVPSGTCYGYRVDGPWAPADGLRFNANKLLLDPYARAVSGDLVPEPPIYGFVAGSPEVRSLEDSAPYVPRSVVVADDGFDWEGDAPHRTWWRDTVIYELHVKGMTALHDRVPPELRGTYAGLGTPAVTDYLRDLGVTAVELLPIHQFVSEPWLAKQGLANYWGYNSLGFFAPHNAYSSSGDRGQQVTEFKAMVRAFHRAGLEVILDVVYNHTAEAGPDGPTLSFRGLDDSVYQRVRPGSAGQRFKDAYWDVTGCGNTVDAGHPFALRMILDSLRYWVTEMHVDGFRFDLLSALTRTDRS